MQHSFLKIKVSDIVSCLHFYKYYIMGRNCPTLEGNGILFFYSCIIAMMFSVITNGVIIEYVANICIFQNHYI